LDTLQTMRSAGKKIVVFADMLELGPEAEELHRQIGKTLARCGIDILLTFGALSKFTNDASSAKSKAHFDSKLALADHLLTILADGDTVLVKGSRGMKMEDIVTALNDRLSQKAGN
jgi:UDP-N-acetylmuramyl pentapeptide synthase